MRGLMHYCINWGEEGCHPDVSKHEYPKELKEGEEIPLWPVGKELEILDKICSKCEHRLFEIEENKCPACGASGEENILSTPVHPSIWPPTSVTEKGMAERFNYKCQNCGTLLYSYKELGT